MAPASIWKYFSLVTVDGEQKRKCLKCNDFLPVPKDSSTGNIINHLKKKGHAEELKKYQAGEYMSSNPRKITSFFDQQQTVDARQRKVDEELVRIQVRQNSSMCFYDDEDVQARTKKAYPDLQVFGRLHFCRVVIPAMAKQIKNNIAQQIGSGYFSITSDGWQKPSKFPALLSVTTHTVDDDFNRMDNVLATIPMEKEHTGEEIARLIEQCLQRNGLNSDRIVAMVRDDASNMQKSCHLLEIDSFQCAAHFYHLVVIDALKSNNNVAGIIIKVRQWVGSTHRSSLESLLIKFQLSEGLPQQRIPMDVATRWNSTYLMLVAFWEMKNALLKVDELFMEADTIRKPLDVLQSDWTKLKRLAKSLLRLNREDFVVIKELCKILKPFHVETSRLSMDQSTASTYLPTIRRMAEYLKAVPISCSAVLDVKSKLVKGLSQRNVVVAQNKLLQLSMLIDTRFAYDEEYLEACKWEYLEENFIELVMKVHDEEVDNEEVAEIDAVEVEDENSMDLDDSIWSSKQKVAISSVFHSRSRIIAELKAELSHYRHNSDRPTREQDIFAWWRKNKERFPWIAEGARILLSVPGTSVSSERTFSIAGLLYANTHRNRLSGRMAEMLILIKANLKKLKLAPSTELDDEEVGKEKGSKSEESGEE